MEESVITNIATEMDIRSILADSIRNIPVTADEIRHESAKDTVIRKAMNYVQKKWPASPVQGELLGLYNCRKAHHLSEEEFSNNSTQIIQERIE